MYMQLVEKGEEPTYVGFILRSEQHRRVGHLSDVVDEIESLRAEVGQVKLFSSRRFSGYTRKRKKRNVRRTSDESVQR
jgi:hypothetical protein